MGSGVEGVSLPGQANESQEQGKLCNMDEGIGIPENMEGRCSRPCSPVRMNSTTSESVENSTPLLLNNVELTHMETNGHEVEVANAFTASENPVTCCTSNNIETDCRKVGESQSPATNSTCSEENIQISLSVVHDRVRSSCEDHLHEESPHLKTYCRKKRRIHESSDVSLNSIKEHDNVGNTSEEHSSEELLHGKRLDSEVQNGGSCPLIQIVEASPPKEDASGVSSKVETGGACKTCSPGGPVEKQSQMNMEEMVPSSDKDLASKNEISQANTTVLPQGRPLSISPNKKLLVLDVNGLLADIVFLDIPCERTPDTIISSKAVFTRPFYKDFLDFCFTHFNVGIWTSRTKRNVELILDFLLGESKQKLLFCWDQFHCTDSGYGSVEDRNKPLVVKQLKKLWEKHDPNLPWEKGQFNESNTLLLDDTPHKALCNPPHTAIFPESFRYTNVNDTSLAPEGELRAYLKGVAEAENVQKYVQENRFGQRPITERNLSWRYYQKVIAACSSSSSEPTTTCNNRYASFNSKAFTEAAPPYNRYASYNRRDNHPSSCSDDTSRRYENYQWKANHSSFGLEPTRNRHGSSDHHYRHGSDHGKPNNNNSSSSSSFSEAVPYRQRRSYHAEAYNSAPRNFSSTSSDANGFRRGNSFHWKATHAFTSPSSNATPPDRHGSRSYHRTNTIPDRRGSCNHWEGTR